MGLPANLIGKNTRLSRILRDGKAVVFAFDHGIEHGPRVFPEDRVDPRRVLEKVVEAGVDAIMTTPGVARLTHELWAGRVPLILKLTGKNKLRPRDGQLLQSPIAGVEEALALDADAVAATVYWGSQHEDLMVRYWLEVRREAERYGLPVMQLAYPRGPAIENMYDTPIVEYGARLAAETGADLIKTYYTGSEESFRRVVRAAAGVPVLMSGGEKADTLEEFLEVVKSVMRAGGKGIVVGRNVFQAADIKEAASRVMEVVHSF